MKYLVLIREVQGAKRLVLSLLSRQPRSFGSFEAIIDTGSPRTVLGAADSIRMAIPFGKYPQSKSLSGFGKGSVPTVEIGNFLVAIKSAEGNSKYLDISLVVPDVPSLRNGDQNTFNHALTLPTLIGMDFLEKNRLKLVVNLPENESYLEDV